ncbi:hypothetical protein JYK02_26685 [Corallococcus macrosporus]|uniref:Phosphoribosylanthranilate isomerase n=1 Tax=Corallococcus macrosporus TaxID=35 RepID=A0ABS3DIJ9_9BACT|nr:hypothetical protein [Corallococcus macrosporus]MBN8231113.1 hypothetical protein [Corallococcus macrosporus]
MRRKIVVHVHGVASPEEAEQLESLGVDLVGVVMGSHTAGRVVGGDDVPLIAASLKRARLCVEPLGGAAALDARTAQRMGVRVVQVPWGTEVTTGWRQALAHAGVEWALMRVAAEADDDPAWVRTRLVDTGAPPPAWAQVEICPSLDDGWRIIRELNESELDAHDLNVIASEIPVLFSLPLSLEDVHDVCQGLSHAKGFSFVLGDQSGMAPGAHHITLEQLNMLLGRLDTEGQ